MNAWIVIASVGAGTYLLRVSMFVALGARSLPAWTTIPMLLVAPAAVGALVATLLFVQAGSVVTPAVPELIAVLAGFVAVRRSGNVMHAFAAGLPVFWALSLLAG